MKLKGPHNPLSTGKLYRAIKELLANSSEDRGLALNVFHQAKRELDVADNNDEKESLRSLMVESLKLAQSSKSANIKAIELYIKHQDMMISNIGEEAKRATEEFMGD